MSSSSSSSDGDNNFADVIDQYYKTNRRLSDVSIASDQIALLNEITKNSNSSQREIGVQFFQDCADCVSFRAKVSSRDTPKTQSDVTFKCGEEVP